MIRALGAEKRVLVLVCVPALAQHGDQTVHSTHTRLRRCRRRSVGAGAPGGGYDLRWEDMRSLEAKTAVPGNFHGLGPLKKILRKHAFECTLEMKLGAHIPGFALVADLPTLARDIHQYTR